MKTRFRSRLLPLLFLPALLPASLVHDRQMEAAVRSSYICRAVLENRVEASAEFGVLTLSGSTEDQADRMLAEDMARSIPWVEEVQNKIILLPSYRETSDPWIARKVLARLRVRTKVNANTTRVTVTDGMVTLSGTALNEGQKERTGLIAAEVAGVHHVRNHLIVAPLPAGDSAPAEQIDDASITAQIIAALRDHDATRTAAVKVAVTEGSVRITGESGSEEQKTLVTQLAREVHGARFVSNTMRNPR